jgi:hypothetical protein
VRYAAKIVHNDEISEDTDVYAQALENWLSKIEPFETNIIVALSAVIALKYEDRNQEAQLLLHRIRSAATRRAHEEALLEKWLLHERGAINPDSPSLLNRLNRLSLDGRTVDDKNKNNPEYESGERKPSYKGKLNVFQLNALLHACRGILDRTQDDHKQTALQVSLCLLHAVGKLDERDRPELQELLCATRLSKVPSEVDKVAPFLCELVEKAKFPLVVRFSADIFSDRG